MGTVTPLNPNRDQLHSLVSIFVAVYLADLGGWIEGAPYSEELLAITPRRNNILYHLYIKVLQQIGGMKLLISSFRLVVAI